MYNLHYQVSWWNQIILWNYVYIKPYIHDICVYLFSGCNKTLTSANGTFHSPNYPGKYPNGQYCSWTITVNLTQQILLIFTEFRLQNKINTDELYVYDGKDSKGEVLGVFYGGHPPPEKGMYSSSKHMFIIFKSDKNNSYTGFKASYFGVNISGKYCLLSFHLFSKNYV